MCLCYYCNASVLFCLLCIVLISYNNNNNNNRIIIIHFIETRYTIGTATKIQTARLTGWQVIW